MVAKICIVWHRQVRTRFTNSPPQRQKRQSSWPHPVFFARRLGAATVSQAPRESRHRCCVQLGSLLVFLLDLLIFIVSFW